MSDRNIILTIEEAAGAWIHKHNFVISIGDNGVEIRRAADPVASRDRSVSMVVGTEPTFSDLVLHVEETT